MIYLQLFWSFFKIGLFGFGGGYAIIALIQSEIEKYGWMSQQEFVDIVAVSQMTPGPIGINSATYVGYTATASVWGSIVATTAIILPSLVIMLTLCKIYFRLKDNEYIKTVLQALRYLVIGLIASAALLLMNKENFTDYWSVFFFALVFIGTIWLKLNPILLIVLSGIGGFLVYGI